MLEGEGLQPLSDSETLSRILSRTASLLQARACGVFYWDRARAVMSPMRPQHGLDEEKLKGVEFPLNSSAMGMCVVQDRAVLLNDAAPDLADIQYFAELNIQNGVAVPLALERRDESNQVVERSVIGAFCALDKYYGRPFDMEDARLLSMMARQASAVLVTSQLYWQEVQRSKGYETLFESTSVGLIAVSPKGIVTAANAAARQALGIRDEGWFGTNFQELIQIEGVSGIIADTLAGRPPDQPRELEIKVQLKEGEVDNRIYRLQVDKIEGEDRQSLGWVTVMENISDIRRAEQMMAAFVDMISHELRTPLTAIRGFVATLLQAGEGTFDWETEEEFLQIVDTEAERLGHMIDEQLNIARIQNGKGMQFHFQLTRLTDVANNVVRLQGQSSLMKANHQLLVDAPEDLPNLLADEGKLQQVMHNLVGNALKYSPGGGEVRIRLYQDGDRMVIAISDQGLGIPKDQLPKMFGQFFRVESSAHTGIKGTGLGLWLTQHIIEGHRGKMWVESEFGHGSTFFVSLPMDPTEDAPSD